NAGHFLVLGAIILVRGLAYGPALWSYVVLGGLLVTLGFLRLRGGWQAWGGSAGQDRRTP
ncbi:MAG: hypothetical protein ACYDAG_17855, partial [Chloroflexota bacterium]